MEKINLIQAVQILDNLNNQFFTVQFIKRSTNELRTMNCRKKVKKYLKYGQLNYKPIEYNLLPVFDLVKNDYRMINLRQLITLKVNGEKYLLTDNFKQYKNRLKLTAEPFKVIDI